MKDLTIVVHDDYIDEVIDSLHESELAEISDVDRDRDVHDQVDESGIPDIVSKCTNYEMKLSSVLDVFDTVSEEESTVSQFLNPEIFKKVKREKKDIDEIFDEIDGLMEEAGNEVLELDDELSEINESITELKNLRENLQMLSTIDIELSYIGESQYTIFRIGTTKNPTKAKKAMSEVDGAYFFSQKVDEDKYVIIAGAYIRQKNEFESALRQGDVRPVDLKGLKGGKPTEALEKVNKRLKKLENKKNLLVEELKDLGDKWEKDFKVIMEELENQRDKKEVLQHFGKTSSTSVIKGWVREDHIKDVEKVVEESSHGCSTVTVEEPEDPDEVPVSLKNPTWLKPYELLTNMFAPPRYDEVDPTFIIGPAFVLFFGLMLGDVIYGSLIVLTSVLILRGIGKVEEGTRRFALLLLSVGVSTIIFGIVQGGYLGPDRDTNPNLVGRLGMSEFFDNLAQINTLSGSGPQTLLVVSLLIGLAYLNIGIFLSFVQHIHRDDKREILLENVPWWLLQPGGFILLSSDLFGWFMFSGTVKMAAWVMTAAGLGILVYKARGLSFFDLTGFIGDFLSFARILALGLATAGIALTVNVLSDMIASAEMGLMMAVPLLIAGAVVLIRGVMGKNRMHMGIGAVLVVMGGLSFVDPVYPFYILALVVMIGGHVANAGLQALGAFVHSLRLQYVEFFGQFYEGGGKPFTPFKPKREYTKVEEEVIK